MRGARATRRGRAWLTLPLAVWALGVFAAPAEAHVPATFTFQAGSKEVKSRADGTAENAKQVISIPGLKQVTCTGVSYAGAVPGLAVTSTTVQPTYSGCVFLGQAYKVLMGQCVFVFNANGQLSIVSETGGDCEKHPIEITDLQAETCEVFIPEQVLTGVNYTNLAVKPEEVTLAIAAKGVVGEKGEDCEGAGVFSTGEYVQGNSILTAYEGATKKSMKWAATVP